MLATNTPIWIPDAQAGYTEGFTLEVVNPGQPARVLVSKTQTELVLPSAAAKQIERRVEGNADNNVDAAPDDLSSLVILSKAALLEALRLRSATGKVYTRVGPILVSVNPFKNIPDLYSQARRELYFDFADPNPHVYETAARAFIGATKSQQDQSIIFSGESGAGKTFATRVLTEFLVYASSRSQTRCQERAQVQQRLQSAQPLIEAFGNAKTTRNDNSSRFGCWTEIEFAANEISAARVVGFNLEKSRVCLIAGRGATEDLKLQRNFHIFYQIISANQSLASQKFRYLGDCIAAEKASIEDKAAFEATLKAIEDLGLDKLENILEVVEGVLFLGNVEFEAIEDTITKEEICRLVNRTVLEKACSLLSLDTDEIERGLIQRDVSNPKEEIWRPHSKAEAEEARDALAKHVYGRLFDWLLVQINAATNKSSDSTASSPKQGIIGLLDTYGFEIFGTNSFEQLCINYCNERIMGSFNEACIKAEHDLYKAEGLVTNPEFVSDAEPLLERSRQCLDLFESTRPLGIFALLDDVVRVPKGTDDQFLYKLREEMKSNTHLIPYVSALRDSKAKTLFGVVHFAGSVHYCVDDFVEKNRDTLHAQLDRTCCSSEGFTGRHLFAESLFSRSSSPRKKTPSKALARARTTSATQAHQKLSLGARFRLQLNDLMSRISQTQTHFVRCIKPNGSNNSEFNGPIVLEQLAYGGVLETCRLRKDGFQVRRSHDDFLATYKFLLGAAAEQFRTPSELAAELHRRYGVDCQIGKSTAFLRAEDFNKLEKALLDREYRARICLQSFARLVVERNKHSKRKLYLDEISAALTKYDAAMLSALVGKAPEIFPGGSHAHVSHVKRAVETLKMITAEDEACSKMKRAIEDKNFDALESAALEAKQLNHDLRGQISEVLAEANKLLTKWREEKAVTEAALIQEQHDKRMIEAAILLQKNIKRFLYRRRVQNAFKQLQDAVATQNLDQCARAMRRLSDLGLRDHPDVQEAAKLLQERKERNVKEASERALTDLDDAMNLAREKARRLRYLKPEDVAQLTLAINRARAEGCSEEAYQEAINLEQELLLALGTNHAKAKAKWWLLCCCANPNVIAADTIQDVSKTKKIA